jgi:hypothetical protein
MEWPHEYRPAPNPVTFIPAIRGCGAGPAERGDVLGREGAGGCLAPEHEDPPLDHRRRDAAARRGHRRALLPAIGCGIVRLVRRQIARVVAVDAAAHGVEASVYRGGRQVVARRRDICERRPPVGGSAPI